MLKSNIFNNSDILRTKGSDFCNKSLHLADFIREKLITTMEKNNWAGISPQNIVGSEATINYTDFYKNIIVIKNFNNLEYFEILNPSYEILGPEDILIHEICGSIETTDSYPLGVLNLVPNKIKIMGCDKNLEKIEFILEGSTEEIQEKISYFIHEINHINGKIITDGSIITSIKDGDKNLNYRLLKKFPDLIASYIVYNGNNFIIHKIGEKGLSQCCKSINTPTRNNYIDNILPFHFDTEYDFDLAKSKIFIGGKKSCIDICKNCF